MRYPGPAQMRKLSRRENIAVAVALLAAVALTWTVIGALSVAVHQVSDEEPCSKCGWHGDR